MQQTQDTTLQESKKKGYVCKTQTYKMINLYKKRTNRRKDVHTRQECMYKPYKLMYSTTYTQTRSIK